jgi:hypothetical protein
LLRPRRDAAHYCLPVGGCSAQWLPSIGDPTAKIQQAGSTYKLRVIDRNTGSAVHPFCLDFTDDHNSRSIEMPGLASYDSDTFCMRRVLGAGVRKTLTAYVIAAKAGAHRMSILIGKGEIHKYSHRAFVTDSHALSWGSQFVIIS